MGKRSIATRWFVNSFAVVAIILAIMDVVLFFMLKSYYYGAVGRFLQSEANIISGVLTRYYESFGVFDPNEMRRSIEEFDKKNKMELMAINAAGEVALTSSGFSPLKNYDMPDYRLARESSGGVGEYVGYFNGEEKYMAVTVALPQAQNSVYSAIRMVTSLEKVDSQIYAVTLLIGALSIAMLLLLLFLGLYFIRSIVSPLRQIGNTARRFAGGDFSVRISQTKNDDEIGELSRVFNDMADELESAEEIKNDFISSVSHELRTPLTAIKGWGETVLELKDGETVEKGMKVIIAETERLTEMVEELLDFSRMQSGRFSLRMTDTDLIAGLTDAVTVYTERAGKEGISLVFARAADEPVFVSADGNRIRQVFINVIDNAVKYGKKGGTVVVDAVADEKNVVVSVKDDGCGISRADLPKVKMRFFKANHTRRGSGIGLAVANEIVLMHSGRLDIESEIGVGTTVKITLPILRKKSEEVAV
ncbi:MAG: HAMP domain-containing histidine kinase [Oscillospiraceae bacterium]|jgi:signal transduction histidine kinase|nr:HAMP domain-containing histidine kinase [Oscillospiraceae bacterium]